MAQIIKTPKKRRVESVKVMNCDRCGLPTTHTLYDSENKVYKCTICGSTVKR